MCKKILSFLSVTFFSTFICISSHAQSNILPDVPEGAEAVSLSGKSLSMPDPTNETIINNLKSAQVKYLDYPMLTENAVWYGRRLAYAGDYREAIKIFSEGLIDNPNDPELYRHRGHRYITIREFDRAIADLEKAAELIKGKANVVEQDGAPNEFGIPISTLHHNIYYHLGLAYYLKQDFENAKIAYDNAFSVGRNDDNKVSVTHWRYMILRRLGKTHDEAKSVLEPISADMKILENTTYHKLDLFYKGEIPVEEMLNNDSNNSKDAATMYGLANWYYYNGDEKKSNEMLEELLKADAWGSFGYIAAEADLNARK